MVLFRMKDKITRRKEFKGQKGQCVWKCAGTNDRYTVGKSYIRLTS